MGGRGSGGGGGEGGSAPALTCEAPAAEGLGFSPPGRPGGGNGVGEWAPRPQRRPNRKGCVVTWRSAPWA
nr:unnamed protein product [Digitaria exilis]